ncbi:MAG: DUF6491 family protein [Rhodospirillaceae bacterium]|jgi:hypothetical protein
MSDARNRLIFIAAFLAVAMVGVTAPSLAQTSATVDVPKTANDEGYILEQFPDRLPQTTNQCIFFRTLYDWKPLNRHNLIVWAPSRKHPYHLQLDRPCQNLRFAHTIGFTSNNGRLCGFGGDSVLVGHGGGLPDRCPIGSITKLDEDGLDRLLAQGRGRTLREKREAEAAAAAKENP